MKLHMHSLQKHWNDFNFGQKIVSENKTVQKFLRDQNFRHLKNTVGIKFWNSAKGLSFPYVGLYKGGTLVKTLLSRYMAITTW